MILMESERELTIAEVAVSLRASVETVRKLLQEGAIPARKQGRQWRVTEADVEEYKRREREKYRHKS